jgi:hypothetical protein
MMCENTKTCAESTSNFRPKLALLDPQVLATESREVRQVGEALFDEIERLAVA